MKWLNIGLDLGKNKGGWSTVQCQRGKNSKSEKKKKIKREQGRKEQRERGREEKKEEEKERMEEGERNGDMPTKKSPSVSKAEQFEQQQQKITISGYNPTYKIGVREFMLK